MVTLAAMLKIYLEFLLNQKTGWLESSLEASRWVVDQK